MNDLSNAPTPDPAIVWHRPLIHNIPEALSDAGLRLERVRVLLSSNNMDLLECVVEHLPPNSRTQGGNRVMIFDIVGEKLNELQEMIDAISDRVHLESRTDEALQRYDDKPRGPVSSVGKHVEIVRARESRGDDTLKKAAAGLDKITQQQRAERATAANAEG